MTQRPAGAKGPPIATRSHATAKLETEPSGASVFVDGVAYCVTSCEVQVPIGDGPHEVRIEKPGFAAQYVTWEPAAEDAEFPPLEPLVPLDGAGSDEEVDESKQAG